jgi:hypothetical protein
VIRSGEFDEAHRGGVLFVQLAGHLDGDQLVRRAVKDRDGGPGPGCDSRQDGAVFPICPGVSGGEFDESRHRFINLTVADVISDLGQAIRYIRMKNPSSRIILTVSPVPLVVIPT